MQIDDGWTRLSPGAWTVRYDYGRVAHGGGAGTVKTQWMPPLFTEEKAWEIAKWVLKTMPDATDIGVFNEFYAWENPKPHNLHRAVAKMRTSSAKYPVLRRTWNGGQPMPGPGWPLRVRVRRCIRRWWARRWPKIMRVA